MVQSIRAKILEVGLDKVKVAVHVRGLDMRLCVQPDSLATWLMQHAPPFPDVVKDLVHGYKGLWPPPQEEAGDDHAKRLRQTLVDVCAALLAACVDDQRKEDIAPIYAGKAWRSYHVPTTEEVRAALDQGAEYTLHPYDLAAYWRRTKTPPPYARWPSGCTFRNAVENECARLGLPTPGASDEEAQRYEGARVRAFARTFLDQRSAQKDESQFAWPLYVCHKVLEYV